ncbi:efflux RND transporter periplasmic adaptor subunit [Rufibacter latericius]|uniref:HlyD family efflux transporter periplasmic adaptor subunit n=1 Tax=Rufibacter latericius TaxID=2487040 RepID=A0A3M9MEC3_9BACT|nr:HlyD family efflux transporter periplasmic adaptor subunit [Rufibacter latericius]RNI23535.1 HlyD family efflux transporter periplasmic adaptor subunit [Rufibacter latericius]
MDREIPQALVQKTKRRRLWQVGAAVVAVLLGVLAFRSVLQTRVAKSELRFATVEVGAVEASLTASGVVVPEIEEVIASPIQAKIERVLHTPGDHVAAGEPLLLLDKQTSQTAFEKLRDEQQLKQNKTAELENTLQKNVNQLRSRYAVQEVRVKSLQAALADEQYLLSIGGGTQENVKKAELDLKVASLELTQLQRQIQDEQASARIGMKGVGYELEMQRRDIGQLQRQLEQADVKAVRKGVVTWVNEEVGANVSAGEPLARVADLSSFKIKATISDNYAEQLKVGGPVTVRINETDLRGEVANVQPKVENGIITFYVRLQEKNHQTLRSNLRVEVFVLTDFRPNVLRVKNGPFYTGSPQQEVFVVQGDKAIRRTLRTGASNLDFVELQGDIAAGEQIILSSTKEYVNLKELQLSDY